MKGVRTRILKKLNSIPQVGYLNNGRILFYDRSGDDDDENKENTPNPDKARTEFRPPDPDSATLFDPNLLAAFRQAVIDYTARLSRERDPLLEFEAKCPPRGEGTIVLYTTGLRGVPKTFEDCSNVRLLLENLRLAFVERDVSMHAEFREEIARVLGRREVPPRLFVRGRYIGGADEVLRLHEQGRLMPLVQGMPRAPSLGTACQGCGGMRFLVCGVCSGSRKVFDVEEETSLRCRRCNENVRAMVLANRGLLQLGNAASTTQTEKKIRLMEEWLVFAVFTSALFIYWRIVKNSGGSSTVNNSCIL